MGVYSLSKSSINNWVKYPNMMAGSVELSSDWLITQTVLGSAQASVTFDVSTLAAQGFKHLQVRVVHKMETANETCLVRFNGDTSTNYRTHRFTGNGSAVSSADFTPGSYIVPISATGTGAGTFTASIFDILDFSSSTKNKTSRSLSGRLDASGNEINLYSGIWFSTAAITSITIYATVGNIAVGSRFSLYASKG